MLEDPNELLGSDWEMLEDVDDFVEDVLELSELPDSVPEEEDELESEIKQLFFKVSQIVFNTYHSKRSIMMFHDVNNIIIDVTLLLVKVTLCMSLGQGQA